MKKNIIDNQRMMLKVADLYYNRELSQQDISDTLNISRPTISKLLKAARTSGIVQITVHDITGRKYFQLEQALEEAFGLKEVLIVDTADNPDATKEAIGQAGAVYLAQILRDGDIVGVSMGSTLAKMLNYPQKTVFSGVTFAPLTGGIGMLPSRLHSNAIAEGLAENFGGGFLQVHAPAMVTRLKTKTELMKEPSIKRVLKKASRADIALLGIDAPTPDSTIVKTGYINDEMLQKMAEADICGEICMNFYDRNGNTDRFAYNETVIGTPIQSLKKIPYAVAMCFGEHKVPAILGAMAGGYINVLITDLQTARLLMASRESDVTDES